MTKPGTHKLSSDLHIVLICTHSGPLFHTNKELKNYFYKFIFLSASLVRLNFFSMIKINVNALHNFRLNIWLETSLYDDDQYANITYIKFVYLDTNKYKEGTLMILLA